MAATSSGRHHHHHRSPTYDEDSNNIDRLNTKTDHYDHVPKIDLEKTGISTNKVARKPQQRTVSPVAGKSLPVNIPEWSKMRRDSDDDRWRSYVDDDDDDDEWLPPHEYLEKIRNYSSICVHEGVGITRLKGRDLSRFRNAIWKQTGFELD